MKKTVTIKDIDCANCAAKIEGMISKLDGVNSCTINFITGKIIIDADDEKIKTLWNSLFKKPDALLKSASTSKRISSLMSMGAGALDGAILAWKLYRKFKRKK